MDLGGSFNRFYNTLKTSAAPPPQISASDTIDKLCERLNSATLIEDRRAALLALKGLSRDWKAVSCIFACISVPVLTRTSPRTSGKLLSPCS
jgi:hypothetical protein